VKDQLPVCLGDAPEKVTQPLKKFRRFAGLAPLITLEGSAFRQGRYFGRRIAVVEQLVHRNFEARANFSSVSMLGMVWPFSTRET
jgi:hypothetical protein